MQDWQWITIGCNNDGNWMSSQNGAARTSSIGMRYGPMAKATIGGTARHARRNGFAEVVSCCLIAAV